MAAAGCSSPPPTIVAGLNEHGGDKLLSKPHMQLVLQKYPELGTLEQAFRERASRRMCSGAFKNCSRQPSYYGRRAS